MPRFTIHKKGDPEEVAMQRALEFHRLPFEIKWKRIIHLISLTNRISKKSYRTLNKMTITKAGLIYNDNNFSDGNSQ